MFDLYDALASWLPEQIADDERRAEYTRDNDGGASPLDSIRTASCGDGFMEIHCTRLLAECDAKRRVLAEYSAARAAADKDVHDVSARIGAFAFGVALLAVALPFADRPGYRDEWKVD